jgi:hypothetical protein
MPKIAMTAGGEPGVLLRTFRLKCFAQGVVPTDASATNSWSVVRRRLDLKSLSWRVQVVVLTVIALTVPGAWSRAVWQTCGQA